MSKSKSGSSPIGLDLDNKSSSSSSSSSSSEFKCALSLFATSFAAIVDGSSSKASIFKPFQSSSSSAKASMRSLANTSFSMPHKQSKVMESGNKPSKSSSLYALAASRQSLLAVDSINLVLYVIKVGTMPSSRIIFKTKLKDSWSDCFAHAPRAELKTTAEHRNFGFLAHRVSKSSARLQSLSPVEVLFPCAAIITACVVSFANTPFLAIWAKIDSMSPILRCFP